MITCAKIIIPLNLFMVVGWLWELVYFTSFGLPMKPIYLMALGHLAVVVLLAWAMGAVEGKKHV